MSTHETSHDHRAAGVFRSILVGYDGSDEAREALRLANALAMDVHGEVHVLQVVRPPAHGETPDDIAEATRSELASLSRGLDDAAVGSFSTASYVVVSDNPAATIASFADEHGVDLIVTGGHGREQSVHRGIGRSLENLLRSRPCPILVV